MPPKDSKPPAASSQSKGESKVASKGKQSAVDDLSEDRRPPALDVSTFIRTQKALVEQERTAELAEEKQYRSSFSEKVCKLLFHLPPFPHSDRGLQDLERAGLCLMRLTVADSSSGLYGRILVTFEPAKGGPLKYEFPAFACSSSSKSSLHLRASKFGVRDIVQLIPAGTHKPGASASDSKKDSKSSSAASSKEQEQSSNADAITGVVYRMKETNITVAFEQHPGLARSLLNSRSIRNSSISVHVLQTSMI
jgi:hypothetical protein